ncbi:hypothetical protein Y017_10300 [Alcanivorax sp. 97CO-5]|nr:hypothetical protein Y017_10300 [Alcanivorax sp. 97CO-5]
MGISPLADEETFLKVRKVLQNAGEGKVLTHLCQRARANQWLRLL